MQDIFKEQIIRRKPQPKDMVAKIGMIIGYFILAIALDLVLAIVGIGGFFFPLFVGAIYLSYVTIGRLKVEYEYSITNDELDIDAIVNRKSRKRMISINLKEVEVMAHNSKKEKVRQEGKIKDYSSGTNDDTYMFIAKKDNENFRVIFEPNEGILEAIGKKMSRSKLHLK